MLYMCEMFITPSYIMDNTNGPECDKKMPMKLKHKIYKTGGSWAM